LSALEAIILGIIQGLTEFLPVSSSGHLELGKALMGDETIPEEALLFTIIVHAATALSTIVVYRKYIWQLLVGLAKFQWNEEAKFVSLIAVSAIPIAIVGLTFEDEIKSFFEGKIVLVGSMLLVTGALLLFTHFAQHRKGKVTFFRSIIIGIAQTIAILPGISRSGSTIAASLLLGVSRERAARFSFLMALPPILGGALLKTKEYLETPRVVVESNHGIEADALIAGFVAAFIAGVFACRWMITIVKKSKLSHFAVYCFLAGITAISAGLLAS
jgi:undecaprenyl-diphosphatase